MVSDAPTDTHRPSVFISYNHADNVPPASKPKVATFVRQLFSDLQYELTCLGLPKDGTWLDYKIKHAEDFTEVIQEAISQSDIFLAVVSRQYIQSDFCAKEIATFIERLGELPEAERKRRIFRVDKQEVPNNTLPPPLRDLHAARFYWKDPETGDDVEFFDRWNGKPDRAKYQPELTRLARSIYRRWQELNTGAPLANSDAAPLRARGSATAPLAAGPAALDPAAGTKLTVFVAKPAADMEDEYHTLVCELEGRGFRVLPDRGGRLPEDGAKAVEAVRNALAAAELSIHLVGDRYGVTPDGLAEGIVALQLKEARAAAEKRHGFARLIWVPKLLPRPEPGGSGEPVPRDPFETLRRFGLEGLLDSDEIESDTASRFNEFVLQRLASRIATAVAEPKACVFVGAPAGDRDLLDAMAKRIKALGAKPIFGPTTLLARADHVVYCWGQADEAAMLDAVDGPAIQAWRAAHPGGRICLVTFPPMTETKASALEVGSYGEADAVTDSNSDDLETQLRSVVAPADKPRP